MEMMCIEACRLLCWLLPIAAELLLRRFLPTGLLAETKWQAALLAAGVIANRFLVAAAHGGYYACCYRLAFRETGDTAATRELVGFWCLQSAGVPPTHGSRRFLRRAGGYCFCSA